MNKEVVGGGARSEGPPEKNLEEPQEGEFGTLVRQLCEERGFSLRILARRARMDATGLSRALIRGGPISIEGVCQLADVLRASPTRMLEVAGELQGFPYDMLESEEVRKAFRKLAERERLNPEDKDHLVEFWYAWQTPPKPRGRKKRDR